MEFIINLFAFVFSLGLIVALHELGHFFFAKRASILCFEYAVGMGPVVWSTRKGETQYAIRAIPIGGFVSMAGEQDLSLMIRKGQKIGLNLDGELVSEIVLGAFKPTDLVMEVESYDLYDRQNQGLFIEGTVDGINRFLSVKKDAFYVFSEKKKLQVAPYDRSFESKTLWQRFLTIFAGPAMNFILAFFLFLIVASIQGKPLNVNRIGNVMESNPASIAGLQDGDRIIQIGNTTVSDWNTIGIALRSVPDYSNVPVTIIRNDQILELTMNPRIDILILGISNAISGEIKGSNQGAIIGQSFDKSEGIFEENDIITQITVGSATYSISSWADIVAFSKDFSGGQDYIPTVTFFREGLEQTVVLTEVRSSEFLVSQGYAPLSVLIGIEPETKFDITYALQRGLLDNVVSVQRILDVISFLIKGDEVGVSDLSGPIGIFQVVGVYAKLGLDDFLYFVAFLSVNIGVMNLLPIPALDGGRLVFLGIEAIIRRPLNKKVENTANNLMFFLLMALFVYVTFFDILRIF